VVFLYDGDLMSFFKLAWLVLASLLAGCAHYAPQKDIVGKNRVDLIAQMGEPRESMNGKNSESFTTRAALPVTTLISFISITTVG